MATRIYLRHGLGKPDVTDFGGNTGELLIDLQDQVIWTLDSSGTQVVMLGADISSEVIDWNQLDNVPTEFPPSDHTHEYPEINDGAGKTLDVEITEILALIAGLESDLGALQGNLTFAGTVAIATSEIKSVTDAGADAGFAVGTIPSPPPNGSENRYFICENGGDFDGSTYTSGDWLVSEGNKGWAGVHFDSTVSINWDEVGNKPTEFPPEDHTHKIADIDDLQDELDKLSADGHTHEIADVTGLQAELDGKASVVAISGGTY